MKDRPDSGFLLLQVGNKGGSLSGYDASTGAKVGALLLFRTLAVLTHVCYKSPCKCRGCKTTLLSQCRQTMCSLGLWPSAALAGVLSVQCPGGHLLWSQVSIGLRVEGSE